MKLPIKIIFTLAFFAATSAVRGQQSEFHQIAKISVPEISLLKNTGKKLAETFKTGGLAVRRQILPPRTSVMLLPDQYTREFGFFCREELQLQKRTGVRFSLRLGTLEYCNYLEGKNPDFGMKQ